MDQLKNTEFSLPRLNIAIYYLGDHLKNISDHLTLDRRFMNSKLNISDGGIKAAIKNYEHTITPNLLIIELDGDINEMIGQLFALSEVCDRETHVIVAGQHNDVELYRELLRYGIAEYLLLPTNVSGLMSIISNLYKEHKAPLSPSVAFIGASGGVGSSIIAQSIALSIAGDYNIDTIFTDLDTSYAMSLLSWSLVSSKNMDLIIKNTNETIEDGIIRSCLVKVIDNLNLLVSSMDPTHHWTANDYQLLMECLIRIRSMSDFSIVDIPTGQITVEKQAALTTASEVVIVTDPTIKGIRNLGILYNAILNLRPNDPAPKVVLNKFDAPDAIHLEEKVIVENIGIQPDFYINYVPEVIDLAIARGASVSSIAGSGQFMQDIQPIIDMLLGNNSIVEQKTSDNFLSNYINNFKKAIGI